MILLHLTWRSLWNRRLSLFLTVFTIAISVALLLGVDHLRQQARNSFLNTISGTDLVVGARSGPVQLLLYSVFRIGNATNNISWESYQHFAEQAGVAWTIPLSLGDSHKGFRVVGTSTDYFKYYRYADRQHLAFQDGVPFAGVFDAVLGAEVARKLGYKVGSQIVLAHGSGSTSFMLHADKPFTVTGILAPTGTPIDRSVHVSLQGIEAIHIDWRAGSPVPGLKISAQQAEKMALQPKVITAFLMGMEQRTAIFHMQRQINDYRREPLLATVPGIALAELWQTIGQFETLLRVISFFVVIAGLLSLLITLLSTLNERRREMAVLRAIGAHPWQIALLYMLEAMVLALLGGLVGMLLVASLSQWIQPLLSQHYGLFIQAWRPSVEDGVLLLIVLLLAVLFSLLPAVLAWRRSLQDGLTIKT